MLPTQTAQELTCLSWSKNGMYLAVGTIKGNVLIYNRWLGRGLGHVRFTHIMVMERACAGAMSSVSVRVLSSHFLAHTRHASSLYSPTPAASASACPTWASTPRRWCRQCGTRTTCWPWRAWTRWWGLGSGAHGQWARGRAGGQGRWAPGSLQLCNSQTWDASPPSPTFANLFLPLPPPPPCAR